MHPFLRRPVLPGRLTRLSRGVMIAAMAALLNWGCDLRPKAAASTLPNATSARQSLVAMARLEPRGRVVRLGASDSGVIGAVFVKEGSEVGSGQILACLQGKEEREAERDAASLKLDRIKLQPYDLEVHETQVREAEATLAHYRREERRQGELKDHGLVSEREYNEAVLQVNRAEADLTRSTATLERFKKSMVLARQEAENDLRKATAQLEQTIVRAPFSGRILKILVQPGERVGSQAVIQMGDTSAMYAVAEVHANDAHFLHAGERAVFSSPALSHDLEGVVEQVGALIYKNDVFGEDPTAPENLRVVQVRIRLSSAETAAGLTNLEGHVRILLDDVR